jgi:hypothetical protein
MTEEPKLTGDDIREMLSMVQADREARQVFLAMPREDQLLSILGMIAYLNSQIAKMQKDNLSYRQTRESNENTRNARNDKLMDTGEMIAMGIRKALDERSGRWNKIADSVITNLINIILIGILILVFGNLKP